MGRPIRAAHVGVRVALTVKPGSALPTPLDRAWSSVATLAASQRYAPRTFNQEGGTRRGAAQWSDGRAGPGWGL